MDTATAIDIGWFIGPYAFVALLGFVLGFMSRNTKIDKLTAELNRWHAEAIGNKIHEPHRSPSTGRRRTKLPDVSQAGVSYVPAGPPADGGRWVESRYQGGQPAGHPDTQPIPTVQDQE